MLKHHKKQLDEQEFTKLRSFFVAGVPIGEIEKLTTRSWPVLNMVRKTTTFQDYTEQNQRHNDARRTKQIKTIPEPTTLHRAIKEVRSTDREVTAILNRIANTLEKMEEHWRTPEKKKLFGL